MDTSFRSAYHQLIAALAVAFTCAVLQPVAAESVKIGNNSGNAVTFVPVPDSVSQVGSALYFPASLMQAYRGCSIVSVTVWARAVGGSAPVRVFIAGSLDGAEPYYEQRSELEGYGWKEVELGTPFKIDGSGLYIGYVADGLIDIPYSNKLVDGDEYVYSSASGWRPCDNGYSAAMYATVEGDTLPRNNIVISHTSFPGYAVCGKPVHIGVDFVNTGLSTVDSLSVVYHVGDSVASETVAVKPVKPRTAGSLSLDGLEIRSEGEPEVWFEVAKVNGEDDLDPSDNVSRKKRIVSRASFPRRKVLLEVFSTERCPNCPDAHKHLSAITDTCADIIEIGHHSGFYTDQLTIKESQEYEWFYKTGRLYAPAIMVDRSNMGENYPGIFSDGVPVVGAEADNLRTLYAEESSVPAFVSVNLEAERNDGGIDIHVDGVKQFDCDASSPRLFLFIAEDSIYSTTQMGASGGFYHRHSVRKSVTPTWGDPVGLDGYSADYHVDMEPSWNADNLCAVAFVANYDENDKNNCRVLNSEVVRVPGTGSHAGISGVQSGVGGIMWDGCTVSVPGGFDLMAVYDMSGRRQACASKAEALSLAGLQGGCYIIKVKRGTNVSVAKIMKK